MQPTKFGVKGTFNLRKGSKAQPTAGGHCIIVNLCDNSGNHWSKDNACNKRWPKAEQEYRRWYVSQRKFLLGEVQEVNVQSTVCIANAIVFDKEGNLDMDALEKALDKIGYMAYDYGSSVHLDADPRYQNEITKMAQEYIIYRGKNVTFYQ